MSLRLIYGRAGSGKSEYILNDTKQKISLGEKVYIITPEQFSYCTEKKLLQALQTNSVINAEVISFNRMAYRIFSEVGGATKTNLSNAGKAMLISSILEAQKKNLKFIGNSKENTETILKTITEFKKHSLKVEDLNCAIDNIEDMYLKTKLSDMNNIYTIYQNEINNKFIDEDDVLTLLAKKLQESKMFENSYIYIDEFSGFTNQEYEIIKELLKKAKQVNITLCLDELNQQTQASSDIFYSNKQVVQKLLDCAKDIKIDEPIKLEKLYRFKNDELMHLEENIYSMPYEKYNKEIEHISLFLAANPYSEIENVAENIIKLVREKELKYNEISIITKNVDNYASITKAILTKYNIPIFIDKKSDLSQNILIKYILSIIEIFTKNWSCETVMNYLKTGFTDIEKLDIYKIEDYCQKYGIRGNKWHKQWDSELEELRKKIVTPLFEFKKKLEGNKTAEEITKTLYEFLQQNNIQEKINIKANYLKENGRIDLANTYKATWNIIINIFDEIVLVFKSDKMTFEKYMSILKTGLNYSDLGTIPSTLDQVTMGDVDRSRSHKVKAIFILGINDGVFPSINKNEGFFNDKDREALKKLQFEMAEGTLESLYEDQFNIYKAFTTSEQEIFLSYLSSEKDGKALRPSILISRIKKMFYKIEEQSDVIKKQTRISVQTATFDKLLLNLYNFMNGQEIDEIWFETYNWYMNSNKWKAKLLQALKGLEYTNIPEHIDKENIKKLYGETLKTSVSKLEQYKKCPFSFYLKYGLKLNEKEKFEIKPIDTGAFMHEVIQEFFDIVKDIKQITDVQIEETAKQIIEAKLGLKQNYIFTSIPKFVVLTNRLKKVIIQSIKHIVYQLKNSDFSIIENEMEFSRQEEDIKITGKIDRIDIDKDNQFIRIIDYKSSNKKIDFNEMIAGLQIQLITYIDTVSKKYNKQPAGAFYFNLIYPIISSNKNLSDEEIEEKIRKEFKMQGLILADVNVVRKMDKTLENGYSDIIPVYLDKDGNVSKTASILTQEQFSNLQKTINKLIKQISKQILSGNIDIKPVYNHKETSCKYCSYKSICGFNPTINTYEYIGTKTKEEILDEIKPTTNQ